MSPRITSSGGPSSGGGGVLSRMAARVSGSRFAKPIARVALVAAGLVLLAAIGRASAAGVFGGSAALAASVLDAGADPSPAAGGGLGIGGPGAKGVPAPASVGAPASLAAPTEAAGSAALATPPAMPLAGPSFASRGRASADDPVILNTAAVDDLRRLPGIGQKRADAILALRARLGRFRAIEDLMKVKGIGRAIVKRLRPLVRLDGLPVPLVDAGAGQLPPIKSAATRN